MKPAAVTSPYDGDTTIAAAMDLMSGTRQHYQPDRSSDRQRAHRHSAITNADFGYNWSGTIGDYVWYDTNQDGAAQRTGEPTASPTPRCCSTSTPTTMACLKASEYSPIAFMDTDANGNYLFDNLPPGNYLVDVYEDSITNDGVRDIVPTTPDVRDVGPGRRPG